MRTCLTTLVFSSATGPSGSCCLYWKLVEGGGVDTDVSIALRGGKVDSALSLVVVMIADFLRNGFDEAIMKLL